jgi:hypothetical protein
VITLRPSRIDSFRVAATAARWTQYDPILPSGVFGIETDTNKAKLGNGVDPWSQLKYIFTMLDETTGLRWEDLRFPAQAIRIPGSGGPSASSEGTLLFPGNVNTSVAGFGQMPHAWSNGSEIHPHLHVTFPTSTATTCVFQFEYKLANVNDNFPGGYTPLNSGAFSNPQATTKHCLIPFPAIDMTGKRDSCGIKWKITRLTDATTPGLGDNYTGDVELLEFDIHYQSDSRGSILEYPVA